MKKKTILSLAALCMAVAANATIIRVSNVNGSSAPYSSFMAAHDAANEGDTIMVDPSATNYGEVTIYKKLVVIGPGFYLTENGIIAEGAQCANFDGITIEAEGTVLEGIQNTGTNTSNGGITIKAHKVIIKRCYPGTIYLRDASNSIIHQNFIIGAVEGYGSSYNETSIQVTNNIITGRVSMLHNSYIAYNTTNTNSIFSCKDCTIEHNWSVNELKNTGTGNSLTNNYDSEDYRTILNRSSRTDKDVADVEVAENLRSTYGAFAGDSPYVLSGIPAAPVIQDLVMPTTVEKGSKMNVTIKVGIQK